MFSKRPFSLEQIELIFEKAGETRWQAFCRIAYETGLRLGDIAALRVDDVDLAGGFIDLRTMGTRKAGKSHLFYIPDSIPYIKAWIEKLPDDSEYMFPDLSKSYTGKVSRDNASRKFKRFLNSLTECKIETQETDGDGVKYTVYGFHSFRVSHATYLRNVGASVDDVQQQLGHSVQQTTKGYIQEDDTAIKQRLVAEHRALPLAGGNRVGLLLRNLEKSFAELTPEEKSEFRKGLSELLTQQATSIID